LQKGLLTKVPNAAGETECILSIHEKIGSDNNKIQVAYFVCTSCERMTVLDETVFCPFTLPENLKITHCHVLIEGVCTKCD
jgi:Fe2+ or Zn2+ uptake regulation protein